MTTSLSVNINQLTSIFFAAVLLCPKLRSAAAEKMRPPLADDVVQLLKTRVSSKTSRLRHR